MSQSNVDYVRMNEEKILKLLRRYDANNFKKLRSLQLKQVYCFLKENLTSGNRWTFSKLYQFQHKTGIPLTILEHNIKLFCLVYYKKRKKGIKSFIKYVNRLSKTEEQRRYKKSRLSFQISVKDGEYENFLKAVILLNETLEGSNKDKIRVLNYIIHTGFTDKTFLKHYYNEKKNTY
ncbi:hypothetical protein [Ulvibacter antarcticus]|uniref:Uncharacterized protein n=1 Tax=Ulvibacter antarcticus TaxID=442714 RepID=A0A3L9YQ76_9FLAO|nr:hypothetical protein [Ulvibacter antarcticus]RMA56642.1 hypothetical protein BXY75_3345 [Ulvibacter antarcticus]